MDPIMLNDIFVVVENSLRKPAEKLSMRFPNITDNFPIMLKLIQAAVPF